MANVHRIISQGDLQRALKYLESQRAAFHTGQMKMLALANDQQKPLTYTDDGNFFVITRIP